MEKKSDYSFHVEDSKMLIDILHEEGVSIKKIAVMAGTTAQFIRQVKKGKATFQQEHVESLEKSASARAIGFMTICRRVPSESVPV